MTSKNEQVDNCLISDEMIVVPLDKSTPPFVPVSAENHDKLKVKHKCNGGTLNGGETVIEAGVIIEFPKYTYIPPWHPKDYAPTGFKRTDKTSAKLIYCPVCKEPILF